MQVCAQEKNWDENLAAALNAPYPNDQIIALKALFEKEGDAQHKVIAAYHISSISRELKLFTQAANFAEKALNLSATHFPGNLEQQDAINAYLVDIYFRAGEKDKAAETIDKHLAVNDSNLDLVWSQQTDGILHRYSSLYCPNNIEELYRGESHIFHPVGIDMGCSYKVYNGEQHAVTVYLTRDNDEQDTRTPHEKAMGAVLINWEGSDYITRDLELETKSGANTIITETVLRSGSLQRGFTYTGTWTSDLMGWTLKSRITWPSVLKESFGRTNAMRLLSGPASGVINHFISCNKLYKKSPIGVRYEETSGMAMELTALVANESLKEAKSFERPDKACLGASSVEGNAVVEVYDSEFHPYAIVGQAVSGQLYLTKAPTLGAFIKSNEPHYFLRQVTTNNAESTTSSLVSAYNGLPQANAILSDFSKLVSGEKAPLGTYTKNAGEKSTITISVEQQNED